MTEPKTKFYTSIDKSGPGMELGPGIYTNFNGLSINGGSIVGIESAPHVKVLLWRNAGCVGEPDRTIEGNTYFPDLNKPSMVVGAKQIGSMKIVADMGSWSDFRLKCCRKDVEADASPARCGIYWGGDNAGACDQIMTNYCKTRLSDPECACINSTALDSAPCVDPRCANQNAYMTSAQKKIVDSKCPNRLICTQQVIFDDDTAGNIVRANFYQICGDPNYAPKSGSGNGSASPSGNGLVDTAKEQFGSIKSKVTELYNTILDKANEQAIKLGLHKHTSVITDRVDLGPNGPGIILIILVLVFVFIVIFVIRKRSKKSAGRKMAIVT